MAPASNFQVEVDPRQPDHADLSRGRQQRSSPRLTLGPTERAAVSPTVLGLLGLLATRDPADWTLEEMRQVQSWRDTAQRAKDERGVAVLTRVLNLGARITQEHERQYRPLLQELRSVNENLEGMRRQPANVSDAIARKYADIRWSRMAREAGERAAAEVAEAWRANPGSPQATMEINAARSAAESEVKGRRPTPGSRGEQTDRVFLDARREIDKRQNERFNHLTGRKAGITKLLKEAGVPVPSEGSAA